MARGEDAACELKRLRAENDRLRRELAVARATMCEASDALRLIREAVETLAPVGTMRSDEALRPSAHAQAEEIIRRIHAIVG